MFSIGFFELLLILIIAIIFIKPQDLPNIIASISKFFKTLSRLFFETKKQLYDIYDDIEDVKLTFHERVEKLKIKDPEPLSFEDMVEHTEKIKKITPKLKIEKPKTTKKTGKKQPKLDLK